MRPILLNCKSMTWSVYLDMPVGFAPAANAQAVNEVVFGEPGLCHVGPFQSGEAQAWLVVLGVRSAQLRRPGQPPPVRRRLHSPTSVVPDGLAAKRASASADSG
jgi:hypothetical protein